jgi:hypothetical protein
MTKNLSFWADVSVLQQAKKAVGPNLLPFIFVRINSHFYEKLSSPEGNLVARRQIFLWVPFHLKKNPKKLNLNQS